MERATSVHSAVQESDWERLRREGRRWAETGQLSRAADAYEAAIRDADTRLGRNAASAIDLCAESANVYWDLGEFDRSDAAIGRVREAAASGGRAQAVLGRALLHRGDDEEAERALRAALEHDPGDVLARRDLGVLLSRAGRLEAAEEQFRLALERQPAKGEAYVDLARTRFLLGRFDDVSALHAEAARNGVRLPDLDFLLGQALIGVGRHAEGAELAARAMEQGGEDLGYRKFASPSRDTGKSAEGQAVYENALAGLRDGAPEVPGNTTLENQARLTCVLMGQHKWDGAEAVALAALAGYREKGIYNLSWANQVSQLADAYINQEKYAQAETLYRTSLESAEQVGSPRHVRFKLAWGVARALSLKGAPADQAAPFLQKALAARVRPFGGQTLYYGGESRYEVQGLDELGWLLVETAKRQLREAEKASRRLLELRRALPNHVLALDGTNRLAAVSAMFGRLDEAESLYRDVLGRWGAVNWPAPIFGALDGLVQLYSRQGRLRDAEALLRDALARLERDSDAVSALARTQKHPSPDFVVQVLTGLSKVCADQARHDEALSFARAVVERVRDQRNHRTLSVAMRALGDAYAAASRLSEAEAVFREALADGVIREGPAASRNVLLWGLARLYRRQGRDADAAAIEATLP